MTDGSSSSLAASPCMARLAGLEHVGVVGDLERGQGVLFDDQHGHALVPDPFDGFEDDVDEHRREPHRGLVEQQQGRVAQQRPGDGEHLLLAAGHGAGLLVDPLPQPGEQLEHPLPVLGDLRGVLARVRAEVEVLRHRHPVEDLATFGGLADAELDHLVAGDAVDGAALVDDLARHRAQQAGDGAQRGRLAGAVGPDQGHDLAGVDGEIQLLHGGDVAVVDADALQLEDGLLALAAGSGGRLGLCGVAVMACSSCLRGFRSCRGRPRSPVGCCGCRRGCLRRSSPRGRAR